MKNNKRYILIIGIMMFISLKINAIVKPHPVFICGETVDLTKIVEKERIQVHEKTLWPKKIKDKDFLNEVYDALEDAFNKIQKCGTSNNFTPNEAKKLCGKIKEKLIIIFTEEYRVPGSDPNVCGAHQTGKSFIYLNIAYYDKSSTLPTPCCSMANTLFHELLHKNLTDDDECRTYHLEEKCFKCPNTDYGKSYEQYCTCPKNHSN